MTKGIKLADKWVDSKGVDSLAAEFIQARQAKKEADDRFKAAQDAVKTAMGKKGTMKTPEGVFMIQTRTSYSWSVKSVKKVFGDIYMAYLKVDDKLVRAKMDAEPMLESLAEVTEVQALVFNEKVEA